MPRLLLALALLSPLAAVAQPTPTEQPSSEQDKLMSWHQLPPLPDPVGFASPFAGVSNDALIVAGGANFPDKKPWEGGTKIYHDRIFVLQSPDAQWIEAGKLPRPIAYGVSVTTPNGVVCIGGNDDKQAYADVFLLQWIDGRVRTTDLPALPQPITSATGALVGKVLYLVGGHAAPSPMDSPSSTQFLAMNLDDAQPTWKQLPTWPGPGRFLAVAGVHDGSLYLFSGISRTGNDDALGLDYLTDAYRYTPGDDSDGQWTTLADLPRKNAAVPSPAPLINGSRFVLLGSGADGGHSDIPMSEHPGFSQTCLVYDIPADRWSVAGHTPGPRVCAPAVHWHDLWVIVSGESRPGIRSPQIWAAHPRP